MLPQIRYLGNPVLSLQTMLRAISFQHPAIPRLIPSGVFDEDTLEAVMVFQRDWFPPVTGRVDHRVWMAIVDAYHKALRALSPPMACAAFPSQSYTIQPGGRSAHIGIIQSMFLALSSVLEGVQAGGISGVHDGASVANVRWIQRLNGQPETGVMDKDTWDTLSRLYALFVTAAQAPGRSRQEVLSGEAPSPQPAQMSPPASSQVR